MALSTGKCLENAMCKVDLPFIVSFQRFLLDFFVDSYQVLSIHLREEERNYALSKRRYFPFSSLSASPTSIVRPWWLTSRSSSFLIHNQHLDQMSHHRGKKKWLKNGNGRFHSCDLGTGGNEKHREWQENKKKQSQISGKNISKIYKNNSRFHSQQGLETEMEGDKYSTKKCKTIESGAFFLLSISWLAH